MNARAKIKQRLGDVHDVSRVGFECGEFTSPIELTTSDSQNVAELAKRGITIGKNKYACDVVIDSDCQTYRLKIDVVGRDGLIVVGQASALAGNITVAGEQNALFVGNTSGKIAGTFTLRGRCNSIVVCNNVTSNSVNAVVDGVGSAICIGEGCMISNNVTVRSTDSHAIIDLSTMDVINTSESVMIEPYVWLASGVSVMKGCTIGMGSIVAAHSLVSSDLPRSTLSAGIPARVLRMNVSWTREQFPSERVLAELKRRLSAFNEGDVY